MSTTEPQPLTTPTPPDQDPGLDAGMCKCGVVWLASYMVAFFAEGSGHTRQGCRRIPGWPA